MSALRLRIRSATGTKICDSLTDTSLLSDLAVLIEKECGVCSRRQVLRRGFPPQKIEGGASSTESVSSLKLSELGINDGDVITVEEGPDVAAMGTSAAPSHHDDDGDLAAAIALSLQTAPGARTFARHIIPADNSCLFNAVALLLALDGGGGGGGASATPAPCVAAELREMIAATVLSDPDTYNEAFLGMTNEAYAQMIMNPDKWGGAIELSILSKHFCIEIASIDCQTTRADTFGTGCNHMRRIYLMYDGIHYDALVENLSDGTGRERGVFQSDDKPAFDAMVNIATEAQRQRKFVDTSNFDLMCLVCGQGLVGQSGAQDHAKQTGHVNFSEYNK